MPAPTTSLATLRPDLAASFTQFDLEMDRRGFIAQQLLPVMEVPSQAGNFGQIPLDQLLQNRNVDRAPGGGYNRGNFTFDPKTYATQERGAEEPVDDREAKMYANYFDAEQVCAMRALDATLRAQEIRVAALIFNTATWTGATLTTAVGNAWSDPTNGTPITDVENAVRKVYTNTGLWPNALVITKKKFRDLRLSSQVKTVIASTGAGTPTKARDITIEMLKAVFDLDHILVAGGTKNTATEGQAATPDQLWDGTKAMVCRVAETNDIREPCLGRIFHWGEDGSTIGGTVETYRDETVRSDIVRVRHDVQEQVLYTPMGHLLTAV
jgi:hypothetical protein